MIFDLNVCHSSIDDDIHRDKYQGFAISAEVVDDVKKLKATVAKTEDLKKLGSVPSKFLSSSELPLRLSRLTIRVADSSTVAKINSGSNAISSYDIIAARPENEKAFQQCCKDANVDIISLDMTTRLPFQLKFSTVNSAVQRGLYMEICYGGCIRDSGQRKNIISNAMSLIRVTRGRNIILSSGAERANELRSPHDVINLATLFGMTQKSALDALHNSRVVAMHAYSRKYIHRSVIAVSAPIPTASKRGGGPDDKSTDLETKRPRLADNDEQ
eukprot:Partr_v1_DN24900_c0_g1_i2_m29910 putative ribonuclease p